MKIEEKDLKVSAIYIDAIRMAENKAKVNVIEFKKIYSNKVEANLFLKNRVLIKNLLLNEKDKYTALYGFMKNNFRLKGLFLKLILLKNGYISNQLRYTFITSILLTLSFYFNFNLETMSGLHFISLISTVIFTVFILIFLFLFFTDD